MVKQLCFKGYSTEEWIEFKKIHHEMFWTELDNWRLKEAKRIIQERIYEEFEMHIGAAHYERSPTRRDDRNGHRYRGLEILGGRIVDLKIPRSRQLDVRFTIFDKWERVQERVLAAMTTAYLLGKSSSAAVAIVEAFGQDRYSRSFLQRLVKNFERRLKYYRQRKIRKAWPYIFIDGMAVKVYDTYYKERVVIFAFGMDDDHNTELLGWVVADSEDEIAGRSLLIDLKHRGLKMPEMFITDGSGGIKAALKLEYPHVPRQLCAFHKVKNINDNLVNLKHRKAILREAGDIYQLSQTRTEAVKRFRTFRARWRKKEPEAVRLFSRGFEDTLRYFDFPEHLWVSIRTTNPLEQFIGKLRDWTSRFSYFQGNANLELALFTYVCYKSGKLVSEVSDEVLLEKPTLFVA
jgi:transposase-like protein